MIVCFIMAEFQGTTRRVHIFGQVCSVSAQLCGVLSLRDFAAKAREIHENQANANLAD
jgi:hypothetical protein